MKVLIVFVEGHSITFELFGVNRSSLFSWLQQYGTGKRARTKAMRDKAPSLARAISELKAEGVCPSTVEHRRVKYLNNVIEGDEGKCRYGSGKAEASADGIRRYLESVHSYPSL